MKQGARRKKGVPQKGGSGSFPIINYNAAGIDIGSEEHWVAAPEGRDENPVRPFGCFTSDLHAMARWGKHVVSLSMRSGCRASIVERSRTVRTSEVTGRSPAPEIATSEQAVVRPTKKEEKDHTFTSLYSRLPSPIRTPWSSCTFQSTRG
jgi:hypothetical protein